KPPKQLPCGEPKQQTPNEAEQGGAPMSPECLEVSRPCFAALLAFPSYFLTQQDAQHESGLEQRQDRGEEGGEQGFQNHTQGQLEPASECPRGFWFAKQKKEAQELRQHQEPHNQAE